MTIAGPDSPEPVARNVPTALRFLLVLLLLAGTGCAGGAAPPDPPAHLVVAVASEPDTLDPHHTSSAVASEVLCEIGGSLVARDPGGAIVPYLARSWTTSPDGLTWTFALRDGVRFHDGTPLTAADWVWTFERALDPETAAPVAGDLLGPVAAVTAPDAATLVLRLTEPFAPLLDNLTACGYLSPLRRSVVESGAQDRSPIGVGPYEFRQWRTGEEIVLDRNPGYTWGPPFDHPGPELPGIDYRFVPASATRLAALRDGAVDVTELDPPDAAALPSGPTLYREPLAGAAPLGTFNSAAAPFDDVRLRRALNLAVDRDALLEVVARGQGEPQYGPISRSVVGYWPGVEQTGYRLHVDRAAALLAEAGYGPGRPLAVTVVTSDTYRRVAEVLREQLRPVGVELTIELVDQATATKRILAGGFQLALVTILYPDSDVLHLLYHSTQGSLPIAHVTDPALDALLDATRTSIDPAARRTATDDVQRRIVEQAYSLPLYTPTVFTAVSARVQGVVVAGTGELLLHDATLR